MISTENIKVCFKLDSLACGFYNVQLVFKIIAKEKKLMVACFSVIVLKLMVILLMKSAIAYSYQPN